MACRGIRDYLRYLQLKHWKLRGHSKSQIGQDISVVHFYREKQCGFFVEIGASDGVEMSNTYLLEKHYGWTGICAEPIPERFQDLVQNRPNAKCVNQPVLDVSDKTVVFDVSHDPADGDLLSGISEHITSITKDRFTGLPFKDLVDKHKTQLELKTISINDLLEKYGAPAFIDYLSLDTEGSELQILEGLDFDKYTIGLIHVEHLYEEPRRSKIRDVLTNAGYVFVRENRWDDVYVHKASFSNELVDAPFVFDRCEA